MTKEEFIKQLEKYEDDDKNGRYNNPYDIKKWCDDNYDFSWETNDELYERVGTIMCEFFEY